MRTRYLKEIDKNLCFLDECLNFLDGRDKGPWRRLCDLSAVLMYLQWRISDVLRRKWEPINRRQDLTDKLKIVSRALCRSRFREWESYEREQNEKKPATVNNVEDFENKELCVEKNVSREGHGQFFKLDGVELGETSKIEQSTIHCYAS